MTIEWFDKKPGEPAVQRSPDNSTVVASLYPIKTVPTVVRLPADLGGQIADVLVVDHKECPLDGCDQVHARWHLDAEVEGGAHVTVIECSTFGQYLWGYE